MIYKQCCALGSAWMAVRVILEEFGIPYDFIQTTIDMDKPRPPEHLALYPYGQVPVLIWDKLANVKRIIDMAMSRPSAQLVYENRIAKQEYMKG